MPDWSLQAVRRTGRSFGVWAAWVLLTGHVAHGKTYGELKRVEPGAVLKQLLLLVISLSVVVYFVMNIPPGPALWIGWGLLIAGGFTCFVVGVHVAVSWYLDYSLSR